VVTGLETGSHSEPDVAPAEGDRHFPRAAKVFAVFVCLVLAWHFLATYTWNASPNATRDAIGEQTLTAYMIPMFGQSWSVFAPNPGSTNQSLEVRATVLNDGTQTETEWFSLTGLSTTRDVQLHPIPSRMYLNDYILADRYFDSAMAIAENIRDQVGRDYGGDNWGEALRADLLAAIGTPESATVDNFVNYELAVAGLVSEAAVARWGDGVTKVQVRVVKTPVVPFAERHTDATTEQTYFVDGWRTPVRIPGLDTAVFQSMFRESDDQ
jgi:hypothetical protein